MRVRAPGTVAELSIDFNTADPQLAETLKLIASYADGTEERLELEAGLFSWLAQKCHRDIGRLREAARQREMEAKRVARARETREKNKKEKE